MWYAIIGTDAENSLEKRQQVRPEHLERIQAMVDEGRILTAGPFPAIDSTDPGPAGFSGSLIVAEFATLDEAKAWAEADPYVTSGAFESVEVKPYKPVLP